MLQRGRKSAAQRELTSRPWEDSKADSPSPKRVAPQPPDHLSGETRAWWAGVVSSYVLEPHEHRALTAAGEAWDRKEQARQVLLHEGLSYTDNKGMIRSRPEVAIERDARAAFLRAVRELRLGEVEPPKRIGGLGWRGDYE